MTTAIRISPGGARRSALVLFALLVAAAGARGQALSVQPLLEPRRPILGETAQYVLEARARVRSSAELVAPEPPALESTAEYDIRFLEIREGLSQSEQLIENGRVTSSYSKTWLLVYAVQPKTTGLVRMPGVSFEWMGRRVDARPISMEVMKEAPGNRWVSLDVRVDDPAPLVNQPVEVTLELRLQKPYVSAALEIPWQKVPNGFVGEPVEPGWAGGRGPVVSLNGTRFDVLAEPLQGHAEGAVLVFKRTLHPIAPGRIRLEGCRAVVDVATRVDRTWPGRVRPLESEKAVLESEPIVLTVRDAPLADRPASYTGVVGNFEGALKVGSTDVKAGDGVTMTLTLEGRGDLASLEAPALTGFEGFSVYPPDKTVEEIADGARRLTIRWLVVPRLDPAPATFPAWSFSWFRPDRGVYETVSVGPLPLTVTGEARRPGLVTGEDTAEGARRLRMLGEGVRAIADDPGDLDPGAGIRTRFLLVVLVPLLAIAGCAFVRRRRDTLAGDASILRRRRASAAAARRLAEAEAAVEARDVFAALARSIAGLVGDKLAIPPARVSAATAPQILAEAGVRDELAARTAAFLAELERLEFGRGEATPEARRAHVARAGELVRELDRELRR